MTISELKKELNRLLKQPKMTKKERLILQEGIFNAINKAREKYAKTHNI